MRLQLLQIASQYSSEAEFKKLNLPKYLLARKHRLLRLAFPVEITTPKIQGVYMLYLGTKLQIVDYSFDCEEAITRESKTTPFDSYKIRQMHSDSDMIVVASYLKQQLKPLLNTGLGKNNLTLLIPNELIKKTWYNTIRKTVDTLL